MSEDTVQNIATRKPYVKPVVNRIGVVPEEMMTAVCVKTPSVCHPGQDEGDPDHGHLKVKS